MPFIAGPAQEYYIEHCPKKLIELIYTDPLAVDKIISTLESLKIYYGGATSANTLVKDAPTMLLGWAFAMRDDEPLQRINRSIEALRTIRASQKSADERALETLQKIVAIFRESRNTANNGGFYIPGSWLSGMLEATQGSFNVLWLTRVCQLLGLAVATNERMLVSGKEIIDALETLIRDVKALERLKASFIQPPSQVTASNARQLDLSS